MVVFDEIIKDLLDLYEIDECLDVLEVTQEECLEILLRHGYAKVPPFLQRR